MKRLSDRKDIPAITEIKDWWRSAAGGAEWKALQAKHDAKLGSQLGRGKIPDLMAKCWACGQRQGRSVTYSSKYSGLERCHVKPLALGGNNEPSNLVVMCRHCHLDSPDSEDVGTFWRWFSNVRLEWEARLLSAATAHGGDVQLLELVSEYEKACDPKRSQDQPLLVNGLLSKGWTIATIRRLAIDFRKSAGRGLSYRRRMEISTALARAHDAAQEITHQRTLSLSLAGLTPSVITSIKLDVDGLSALTLDDFDRVLNEHGLTATPDCAHVFGVLLKDWLWAVDQMGGGQEREAAVKFLRSFLARARKQVRDRLWWSEDTEELVIRDFDRIVERDRGLGFSRDIDRSIQESRELNRKLSTIKGIQDMLSPDQMPTLLKLSVLASYW